MNTEAHRKEIGEAATIAADQLDEWKTGANKKKHPRQFNWSSPAFACTVRDSLQRRLVTNRRPMVAFVPDMPGAFFLFFPRVNL
ncbi:hypothetical protein [Collimonas sp. OK307]|uniref:hypothetical protein n=1 Tax=Collimonas sp. OK307 TaxID=1801620 RepID=UPI0011139762|nr:hypothetical protein [Collimonas sp. OK307]